MRALVEENYGENQLRRWEFNPHKSPVGLLPWVLDGAQVSLDQGSPAQVFAEALRVQGFTLFHFTASPRSEEVRATWRPGTRGERRYMFLFVAKGDLRIDAPETRISYVGDGFAVGLPSREPITFAAEVPVDALCLTFDAKEIAPLEFQSLAVRNSASTANRVFVAAYAALRALLEPHKSFKPVEDARAVRTLLRGTARGLVWELRERGGSVFENAMSAIAELYTDPALTTTVLARECGVSTSTLNRSFADRSTSAGAQIKRHRVESMLTLLSQNPSAPAEELYALAGFGSMDSWRRARRWYDRYLREAWDSSPAGPSA